MTHVSLTPLGNGAGTFLGLLERNKIPGEHKMATAAEGVKSAKEVTIETIWKMLAGAADTGHSN